MSEILYMSESSMEPTTKLEVEAKSELTPKLEVEPNVEPNVEPTSLPEANVKVEPTFTPDPTPLYDSYRRETIKKTVKEIKTFMDGMDAAEITLNRAGSTKVKYELLKYDKYRKVDLSDLHNKSPQQLDALLLDLTNALESLKAYKYPFEDNSTKGVLFMAIPMDALKFATVVFSSYIVYRVMF